MKKITLLSFMVLALVANIFAQQSNGGCGFVEDQQTRAWRDLNHQRPNWQNEANSRQTYYIPIKFHVVCKDNGTSCFQLDDVLNILCELNAQFEPTTGFHFYIYQDIEFINSTYYWSYDKDATAAEELQANFNVPGVYNAYIVNSVTGLCGRSRMSPREGGIELIAGCLFPGQTTFAHETGHWFSLPHTFSGWEGTTCYSALCNPSTLNCWESNVEYVNSTPNNANPVYDCYKTGDGFCDTRADYYNERWGGITCPEPCNWKDPDGVKIDADESLYMSYANDPCTNRFSPEQLAQMISFMKSPNRNYLLQVPHGTYAPITDAVNLTFPSSGATQSWEWLQFNWDAVNNATQYHIQASRLSNFSTLKFDKIVNTNSYKALQSYFSAADVGKPIYWRVRGFNPDYTCGGSATYDTSHFILGALTGVNIYNNANSIEIYPNPVENNQFMLTLDTETPFNAKCEILNLNGQVILSENLIFNQGVNANSIILPKETSKGIYMFRLTSAGVNYIQKIAVL